MATKVICAFASTEPDLRPIPAAFSAVSRLGDEFTFPTGETIDEEWFNELVGNGQITPVDPEPVQDRHCIYLPEGRAAT